MALLAGLAVGAPRLERVEQRRPQLLGLIVGQRLRADLHGGGSPVPTMTTDSGALPERLVEDVLDLLGGGLCRAPCAGIDTLVPPSKSIPKVKPRSRMLASAMATITPLIAYQSLRLPMTSKAPVPV